MIPKTRSFSALVRILLTCQYKYNSVRKVFASFLLYLFIGFFFGNLFGTFVTLLRTHLIWDGLIGFFLLVFIEMVSYFTYHRQSVPQLNLSRQRPLLLWGKNQGQEGFFIKGFNYFKIGLMLGFFIDAFKVGS